MSAYYTLNDTAIVLKFFPLSRMMGVQFSLQCPRTDKAPTFVVVSNVVVNMEKSYVGGTVIDVLMPKTNWYLLGCPRMRLIQIKANHVHEPETPIERVNKDTQCYILSGWNRAGRYPFCKMATW